MCQDAKIQRCRNTEMEPEASKVSLISIPHWPYQSPVFIIIPVILVFYLIPILLFSKIVAGVVIYILQFSLDWDKCMHMVPDFSEPMKPQRHSKKMKPPPGSAGHQSDPQVGRCEEVSKVRSLHTKWRLLVPAYKPFSYWIWLSKVWHMQQTLFLYILANWVTLQKKKNSR